MVLYSIAHCMVSRTTAATPDAIMHLSTCIKQRKWKPQVLGSKETLSVEFSREKESRILCSSRHLQRNYHFILNTAIESI